MNELVYLKNDEAVCDSLQVAEKFGKRHDKLIAEIRRMYGELIGKRGVQNGGAKFFFESTYEYAKGQGSSHAEMLYMTYTRLANKMAGINKRDEATVMQLNNLSLMENIILHEVDLGIMQGKHYQEIYRACKKRLEAVKDLAYLEAV